MSVREEQDVGSIEFSETDTLEDPEPKLRHFIHPTDPALRWCGSFSEEGRYPNGKSTTSNITCPICLELFNRMGGDWWWDTHRRYYESHCHCDNGQTFHDCPYV